MLISDIRNLGRAIIAFSGVEHTYSIQTVTVCMRASLVDATVGAEPSGKDFGDGGNLNYAPPSMGTSTFGKSASIWPSSFSHPGNCIVLASLPTLK